MSAYLPPPGYPLPYHSTQLDGQQRPGGGTAVTAGVLAVLGGMSSVFVLLVSAAVAQYAGEDDSDAEFHTYAVLALAASIVMVLTLIGGGVLLFLRKRAGQWLVAAGCVVTLALFVGTGILLSTVFSNAVSRSADAALHQDVASSVVPFVLFSVPALATLVLVLLAPTTRYLTWSPGQGAHQPGQPPLW